MKSGEDPNSKGSPEGNFDWSRKSRFPRGAKSSKLDKIVNFRNGWRGALSDLKEKAEPENWGANNRILHSYITQLFRCIVGKFLSGEDSLLNYDYDQGIRFNYLGNAFVIHTGLFDPTLDEIFGCFALNPRGERQWNFDGWLTHYEVTGRKRLAICKRFTFFENFHQLYYNPEIQLICNASHFVQDDDSHARVRKIIGNVNSREMAERLKGAIAVMITRASQNFRTVVPQYFHDKNNNSGRGEVQLLLPLVLGQEYLVVAVSKQTNPELYPGTVPDPYNPKHWCYFGSTILTKDMAYNNARLLNRLESEWLVISQTEEMTAEEDDESVFSLPQKGPDADQLPLLPLSASEDDRPTNDEKRTNVPKKGACDHFKKGTCRFGEKCRYSHV